MTGDALSCKKSNDRQAKHGEWDELSRLTTSCAMSSHVRHLLISTKACPTPDSRSQLSTRPRYDKCHYPRLWNARSSLRAHQLDHVPTESSLSLLHIINGMICSPARFSKGERHRGKSCLGCSVVVLLLYCRTLYRYALVTFSSTTSFIYRAGKEKAQIEVTTPFMVSQGQTSARR